MPSRLNATTGAALLGTNARQLNQEYRRVLAPVAGQTTEGSRQLGFRELLYFELISSLSEQGLQLSPSQKQEVFGLLVRRTGRGSSNWRRRPGQLVRLGPVPLSLDVVVEQLRAGTPRQELEHDFPQLSQPAFDYAEIQARLPKPPGRPRKSLKLQRD